MDGEGLRWLNNSVYVTCALFGLGFHQGVGYSRILKIPVRKQARIKFENTMAWNCCLCAPQEDESRDNERCAEQIRRYLSAIVFRRCHLSFICQHVLTPRCKAIETARALTEVSTSMYLTANLNCTWETAEIMNLARIEAESWHIFQT